MKKTLTDKRIDDQVVICFICDKPIHPKDEVYLDADGNTICRDCMR